ERVPVKVSAAAAEKHSTIDMKPAPPTEGRLVPLGQFRFEKAGQSFVLIANEGTKGHVTPDAVTFIPAEKVPTATTKGNEKPKAGTEDVAALEAELKKLQANPPKRPMAMSVVEEAKIEEIRVDVRGSVHSLGEPAPRGFLQVASAGPGPAVPHDPSGPGAPAGADRTPEDPPHPPAS